MSPSGPKRSTETAVKRDEENDLRGQIEAGGVAIGKQLIEAHCGPGAIIECQSGR